MPQQRTNSRRAATFWKRLTQNYGARLAEQYGPTCPSDWCEVIDRTDDDRLTRALRIIRQEHLQFPPTLGQFEKAIPSYDINAAGDSAQDRLARYAVKTLKLCEHQLWPPWSYFGKKVNDGTVGGSITTTGVVVPACKTEGCPKFGLPNHRILLTDLPGQ